VELERKTLGKKALLGKDEVQACINICSYTMLLFLTTLFSLFCVLIIVIMLAT